MWKRPKLAVTAKVHPHITFSCNIIYLNICLELSENINMIIADTKMKIRSETSVTGPVYFICKHFFTKIEVKIQIKKSQFIVYQYRN